MIDSTGLPWIGLLAALLAAVAWEDLRRGIVPDALNAGMALAGIAYASVAHPGSLPAAIAAAAVVFCMLAAVRARYARWRGYHGLGMGDVKLLAASTVWVGPLGVSWLILAACLSALATIAVMRLRGRTIGATTRLPFGPHIAVGLVVVLAGGSTT